MQIKPNFKALGTLFGKDMVLILKRYKTFSAEKINQLRVMNCRCCYWWCITLTVEDVEISSQDIEGWLVIQTE
jgi:isoleucyl-tRNA synthetase